MTNHWIDLQHADVIMIIGSNAAENHPISFKWITKAMEKGGKLISVDPRFTRTSSKADLYMPLRSGTDVAFIGGIIKYVLDNNLYHKEYVVNYTNAAFLIDGKFGFKDGRFTGFDDKSNTYTDKSSWNYKLNRKGIPKMDTTLKSKHCVFNLLKQHFSRYDMETVCKITGTPMDEYKKICELYASTGKPDRVGTIMYAMGTTQHTHGTQNIRSYAILQLLLGNIGRAGGGINALRGESNVQGSTDHALLFHILPGYLKVPDESDQSLARYLEHWTPKNSDPHSLNWWQHTPKYTVSLLKAFWGPYAVKENDFAFDYLPKRGGNYSHISLFEAMYKNEIKGLFLWGQNPAVGGPNVTLERKALENLEWMVAADLWETETSTFWKAPGVDPSKIKTEVFLLPAAASMEKEGSVSNSGRWAQWRYKAVNPPGEARSDSWIMDKIFKILRAMYKTQGGSFPGPLVNLYWNYGGGEEPDAHRIAKEINGYSFADGKQMVNFTKLKDDGSTCSGNWLYSGSYTEAGNMMERKGKQDTANGLGMYPEWTWCWPVNRRIIYNRASVDPSGKPYDPDKWVIKWDPTTQKWLGDVPDGGMKPEAKFFPFIMLNEGTGRLFAKGLADGPFPEHYEPIETPVPQSILPNSCLNSPAVHFYRKVGDALSFGNRSKYPIVATTYRVSEHWQAGMMTRYLPWLCELMPDMFVEISEELAKEKNIINGEGVRVNSARGSIVGIATVTKRLKPFKINGKIVHEIGMPWHWGYCGISTGDSANSLTPHVGDVNTRIPEFKAFLVNIEPVGPVEKRKGWSS